MRMKKFLTFLLTLAMVVSMLPATAFAANNTATTMRLAKTQGTVAVTNATGKQVKQTGNMKLYNGYKIKTGAKSYAWISLDNTKAAKLDANSVVSVQKSGQKLTLYLSSGNLFFNVKDPLKSGESFHIKTSTMTTGIRGTSGCVRVINDRVTEVHLLTGQVEIYTENPALHISKTAVLKAGQKATSLIADEAMAAMGEQAGIIIEQLTHEEVCGNCSKEIAADPALVERIRQEAPHLLPEKIAAEADERLAADEKAAEEKQAAIDEKVAQQVFPEEVDPYFEVKESSGGGGGGGGGGSSAPEDEEVPDEIEVDSWEGLIDAVGVFNENEKDILIRVVGDFEQDTTDTVTVENNGKTLTIDLTTAGFDMSSTITNNGDLVIKNTRATITTTANTVVKNSGTFTLLDGTLQTKSTDGDNSFVVVNDSTGTFTMAGGALKGADGNLVPTSYGVMNSGTFKMSAGAIQNVVSAVANSGTVEISGSALLEDGMNNASGGTVTVNGGEITGVLYNEGAMIISGGVMSNADGVAVNNNTGGTLTMTGGSINVSDGGVGIDITAGSVSLNSTAKITVTDGIGVNNDNGEFNMVNGSIIVDGGVGVSVGQSGDANLAGGTITVNSTIGDEMGIRVSSGSVTLDGTVITVNGNEEDEEYENYGIFDTSADSIITITSGEITAESGATNNVPTGNAYAIFGNDTAWENFSCDANATVRATISTSNVMTPAREGYSIEDGEDGYFYLQGITTTAWSRFVNSIMAFNGGDSDETIRLTENVTASDADLEMVEMVPIGNGLGSTLTIDLGEYTLNLPQPLETYENEDGTGGSPIIITGGENGTLTANNEYLGSSPMIYSAGPKITIAGGNIIVPDSTGGDTNASGVQGYEVEMTRGTITVGDYSYGIIGDYVTFDGGTIDAGDGTGIQTYNTATLSGGTITSEYGVGVEGVSETGVITLAGASIETDAGTGVLVDNSRFVMTSGEINVGSGATGVHNYGEHSVADLLGGTITVEGGAGQTVGVYNEYGSVGLGSEVAVGGTTINVNGSTVGENFETFGIYDLGGTVNIVGGQIIATTPDGMLDENGEGNAYALYTDNTVNDPEDGSSYRVWADITFKLDEIDNPIAVIRSNVDNVDMMVNPVPSRYSFGTESDGDYYRVVTAI